MPDEPRGSRSNDLISGDVLAALEAVPEIDTAEIDIDVDRGVVTLNGTVDDYPLKERAEKIAGSVDGVLEVVSHLRIRKDAGVVPDVRIKPLRTAK